MTNSVITSIVKNSINYKEVENTIALIDMLKPCLKRNMKRRYNTKHGDKGPLAAKSL